MRRSEVSGHALSVVALVAGGLVYKSIVLNWIVGPLVVVACAVGSAHVGEILRQRRGGS